jgi:hypothetical protein
MKTKVMTYETLQKECAYRGFTETPLSEHEYRHLIVLGMSAHDIYGIACDMYCEAFETLNDAIEFYANA